MSLWELSPAHHCQVHPIVRSTVYCQPPKMRFQLMEQNWFWGQHAEMLAQASQPWYTSTSDPVQITEGGVEEKESKQHTASLSSANFPSPGSGRWVPASLTRLGRNNKTWIFFPGPTNIFLG